MTLLLIIGLLLGGLVIIFTAQNVTTITVMLFSWKIQGSLALILVIAVVIGMLICSFISLPTAIRRRLEISRLRKEVNRLEEEVAGEQVEIEAQKSKVAANEAYLDDLEKNPQA